MKRESSGEMLDFLDDYSSVKAAFAAGMWIKIFGLVGSLLGFVLASMIVRTGPVLFIAFLGVSAIGVLFFGIGTLVSIQARSLLVALDRAVGSSVCLDPQERAQLLSIAPRK